MSTILEKNTAFRNKLLISCALFSFSVLIASFLAQYIGKIEPCKLCKFQRIPYYFLSWIPLLGLSDSRYPKIKFLIILGLTISGILSSYHLMVISGIIKDFCAVSVQFNDKADFMKMLESPIPCAQAGWKFLGMPIPGYNLLFSSVFFVLFARKQSSSSKEFLAINYFLSYRKNTK